MFLLLTDHQRHRRVLLDTENILAIEELKESTCIAYLYPSEKCDRVIHFYVDETAEEIMQQIDERTGPT